MVEWTKKPINNRINFPAFNHTLKQHKFAVIVDIDESNFGTTILVRVFKMCIFLYTQ